MTQTWQALMRSWYIQVHIAGVCYGPWYFLMNFSYYLGPKFGGAKAQQSPVGKVFTHAHGRRQGEGKCSPSGIWKWRCHMVFPCKISSILSFLCIRKKYFFFAEYSAPIWKIRIPGDSHAWFKWTEKAWKIIIVIWLLWLLPPNRNMRW